MASRPLLTGTRTFSRGHPLPSSLEPRNRIDVLTRGRIIVSELNNDDVLRLDAVIVGLHKRLLAPVDRKDQLARLGLGISPFPHAVGRCLQRSSSRTLPGWTPAQRWTAAQKSSKLAGRDIMLRCGTMVGLRGSPPGDPSSCRQTTSII
jgi:hypothetical protein